MSSLSSANIEIHSSICLSPNILTRRIHDEYTRQMEEAGNDRGKQPPPLVITIEEAHKFLSTALAKQTIFGIIAREMRNIMSRF